MSAKTCWLLVIALCCAVIGYLYRLGKEPRTEATFYGWGTFFTVLAVAIEIMSQLDQATHA